MSDLQFEVEGRFLSLRGPFIDSLGSIKEQVVPTEHIQNRLLRDGEDKGHHITVINHLEIKASIPDSSTKGEEGNQVALSSNKMKKLFRNTQRTLLDRIEKEFGDASTWERPVDLGLGRLSDGQAETFYRVVFWPFGRVIRSFVGLNTVPDFHITVGFAPRDVHLYKGPATLVCLQPDGRCTEDMMNRLISFVPFYIRDTVFIKALYWTCWRYGYYKQAGWLTTLCIQSLFRYMISKLL